MTQGLQDWLLQLEQRMPESRIELGLDRVREVAGRLGLVPLPCPVITVAGTNGKGSVVAMIEAICRSSGISTLAYTSPHLLDFNERIRVDGKPATSRRIVEGLSLVEQARGDVQLTYFEHVTLAALAVAMAHRPDVAVLEVGLGGRLDAVNVVDADVAVMTSIGLDHTEWLGRTRLSIGREKAGIARAGRPLIVGERRLPAGLEPVLRASEANLALAGRDFRWRSLPGDEFRLDWAGQVYRLPRPALGGDWQLGNAACAVMAVLALGDRLAISDENLAAGLEQVRLPGRLQQVVSQPAVWLDVAHNAAAARALAGALGPVAEGASSTAVFSVLADKHIRSIGRALNPCFNRWLVSGLEGDRARPAAQLADGLREIPVAGAVETVESVAAAVNRALQTSESDDRIVVFGSFRTVAAAAEFLNRRLDQRDRRRPWTKSSNSV